MTCEGIYKDVSWRKTFFTANVVSILLLIFFAASADAVLYVKPTGNDANSGLSWALAKKTVRAAINTAGTYDEIWVAAGTYAENIQIIKDIALYGGFKGDETAREQRNWGVNISALNGSSSGTVVTIAGGVGANARLDGFTVTGGSSDYGGGISISGSSPTIASNVIKLNLAAASGGGIFCSDSSPIIIGNNIISNFSGEDGGGIGCWRNSSPIIANNWIVGNASNYTDTSDFTSEGGGGIFTTAADLDGSPDKTCVAFPIIINNIISANGGDNGAGIRINDLNFGTATVTNNTIVANSGTAICWQREFSDTSVVLSNNILAFNAWGMQQRGTTAFQIRYNNVFGNSLFDEKTDYIALPDQTGTNGNISVDPHLANYKFGNFHLQPDSPCRDAGLTTAVGATWKDIDGQNRILGNEVDMGADESDGSLWRTAFPVLHVKPNGNDSLDGLTWATAKKTLSSAIYATPSIGWEVWVAKGTYPEHIYLAPFVYLYGGFNGTETSRDSRNVLTTPTIIDGGGTKTIVSSVNTGFLVSALDGFTIQNGGVYTAGGGINPYGVGGYGGGIYINVSSPRIANNLIRWNSLAFDPMLMISDGGGIYSRLSYSTITGNTITQNEILDYQSGRGAGVFCALSGLMIRDNTIEQNHSRYGSAIYCMSSFPYIKNNVIENNAMYGPPVYAGSAWGAISLYLCQDFVIEGNLIRQNSASVGAGICGQAASGGSIVNNVITGNIAVDAGTGQGGMGGGMYWEVPLSSTADSLIINNTITMNSASNPFLGERGGGMAVMLYSNTNKMGIANNIVASNSSGIYSLMYHPNLLSKNDVFNSPSQNYIGLSPGTGDISVEPGFVDGISGDFDLTLFSPCLDAGSNSAVPAWLTTDCENNPRIIDGNGDGNAVVDMGAFEFISMTTGLLGDINKDEQIDVSDVILVLRIALQLDPQAACSDINEDGGVDISDVILTLRMALGLDNWRPCT
jgi:hypothetical protein